MGYTLFLFTPILPNIEEHVGEDQKLNVINLGVGKVCWVCSLFWAFVLLNWKLNWLFFFLLWWEMTDCCSFCFLLTLSCLREGMKGYFLFFWLHYSQEQNWILLFLSLAGCWNGSLYFYLNFSSQPFNIICI